VVERATGKSKFTLPVATDGSFAQEVALELDFAGLIGVPY
jgi:hypothetical protein